MKNEMVKNAKKGVRVIMRKSHACGGNSWEILRTGADFKLKCEKCNREVWFTAGEFRKAVKKLDDTHEEWNKTI